MRKPSRMLQDGQFGLVVKDLIEHIGRVPHRGGEAFAGSPYASQ